MIKVFCDHCGKELHGIEANFFDEDSCYFSKGVFTGGGFHLCDKCMEERDKLHEEIDRKFFITEH